MITARTQNVLIYFHKLSNKKQVYILPNFKIITEKANSKYLN